MVDYKRLISYIYSYEKGIKTKNSGFAKIESRNGVCKLNISLRISDILMNEAEDNSLEVFLFCRRNGRIEKIFLGRIRIVSGSSEFRIQMNAEKIGTQEVGLSEISGLFICSRAFLHKNSQLNIIYASEWDDIPIDVDAFTEENHDAVDNKVLQDNEKKEYNKENNVIYEQSEIRANEINEAKDDFETTLTVSGPQEEQTEDLQDLTNEISEPEEVPAEQSSDKPKENMTSQLLEEETAKDENVEMEADEIEEMPDCQSCREQLKEMLSGGQSDRVKNKTPDTGDYFKMLCNCYPKIKVDEIDGECIKITPHDISYLPRTYWHLCNNSFLLHGFYNYKYLLLCEKTIDNIKRYMICVPGMFHNKEQAMARMFGFTEFEGGQQSGRMNFGYWCMYL